MSFKIEPQYPVLDSNLTARGQIRSQRAQPVQFGFEQNILTVNNFQITFYRTFIYKNKCIYECLRVIFCFHTLNC